MFPFPITFWSSGQRISVTSPGFIMDSLSVQVTDRVAVQTVVDMIVGTQTLTIAKIVEIAITSEGLVADELTVQKIARSLEKTIEDLLVGTESVNVLRDIEHAVQESGTIQDSITRQAFNRDQVKTIEDLLTGSEAITLSRRISLALQEAGLIVDSVTVTKITRNIVKTMSDLIRGTESMTTSATLQAPRSLSATPTSISSIQLTWTSNTPGADGFEIWHSTNGSSYTLLTTVSSTSYNHTGLGEATTHWYRVRAYKTVAGTTYYSANSNSVSATTLVITPEAPTLSLQILSTSSIRLDWNDVANATSYVLQHSTNGSDWSVETNLSAGSTTYTDTNLGEATLHYYRLRAVRTVNDLIAFSEWSNVVSGRTLTQAPSTPTGVLVTVLSPNSLRFSWNDVGNETGYEVYHSTTDSSYTLLATKGANVTSHDHSGLGEATLHYYQVRAYRTVNGQTAYSGFSNSVNGRTATITPAVPSMVSVTPLSTSSLRVAWSNVSNETGYELQHSTDGTNWSAEGSQLPANTTSYDDTGLGEASLHYYRARSVRTVNGQTARSNWSGSMSARTLTATPAAPSSASFTTIVDDPSDDLGWVNRVTWSDNAGNESGFQVWVSRNGGSYTQLSPNPGANVTQFNDTNVTELTQYRYRVRAYRTVNGQTAYSSYTETSTLRTLALAPTGLTATALGPSTVQLSWTNQSSADSVRIYRNGNSTPIVTVASTGKFGAQNYQDLGASVGANNTYEVRAYDSSTGTESTIGAATVVVTTPVIAPSNLTATDTSYCINGSLNRRVTLQWNAGTSNASWNTVIERSINGSPFSTLTQVPATTTVYRDESSELDNAGAGTVQYRVYHARSGFPNTGSVTSNTLSNIGAGPICPGSPSLSAADTSFCASGTSNNQVQLQWTASSGWTVRIERSVNGGSYALLDTFNAPTNNFTDTGLTIGNQYQYRGRYQRTVDGTLSYGPWSTTATLTMTNKCVPVIAGCSASSIVSGTVTVNWTAGALTESVRIEVRDANSDALLATQNADASPNTAGVENVFVGGPSGRTVYAIVIPYSGNNQTGISGAPCNTNSVVI